MPVMARVWGRFIMWIWTRWSFANGFPFALDGLPENSWRRSGSRAVPELVLTAALDPPHGSGAGVSVLSGLPFVSSILMKIYHSIGVNWERLGNLRFAVTYKPFQ